MSTIIFREETNDQECARLASYPEQSDQRLWSELPVLIERISLGMIIELPDIRSSGQIIVAVVKYSARADHVMEMVTVRDRSFYTVVVASKSQHYSVGDIIVAREEELRRGKHIIINQ